MQPAFSSMAHYLPKKKYLQLLHDPTPPGSNAPPSTSSDELSPPEDGTAATLSPPAAAADEQLGGGGYFIDISPSPGTDDCDAGFQNEQKQRRDDGPTDRNCGLYQTTNSSPATMLFQNVDNIFLHRNAGAPQPGDRGMYRENKVDMHEVSRTLERDDCKLSMADKSYCDSVDGTRPTDRTDGSDTLHNELLDNNTVPDGLLPCLTSFSALPDVDLLCGLQSSSGSFSSFLNSFESNKPSPRGCVGRGHAWPTRQSQGRLDERVGADVQGWLCLGSQPGAQREAGASISASWVRWAGGRVGREGRGRRWCRSRRRGTTGTTTSASAPWWRRRAGIGAAASRWSRSTCARCAGTQRPGSTAGLTSVRACKVWHFTSLRRAMYDTLRLWGVQCMTLYVSEACNVWHFTYHHSRIYSLLHKHLIMSHVCCNVVSSMLDAKYNFVWNSSVASLVYLLTVVQK